MMIGRIPLFLGKSRNTQVLHIVVQVAYLQTPYILHKYHERYI